MNDITIAGAGPTGLATALFLKKKGFRPYIFEKRLERPHLSKAFGVNPRTLTLLKGTGATERFLENGRKMTALNLWRDGEVVLKNDFGAKDIDFPFMLVQSQEDSEHILEELLGESGVTVDRGKELASIEQQDDSVFYSLVGQSNPFKSRYFFGADGAGSTTRKSLDLSFDGSVMNDPWNLYDLELDLPLNRDEGHIFLLDGGAVFTVRLKDDVWRVIGNVDGLLDHLPKGTTTGKIIWDSDFGISHRVIEQFRHQNVFFGGDAAHIHSGLGARGMNLGIEDAYVFAELYSKQSLDEYNIMRKPVVDKVMDSIEMMTDMMRGHSFRAKIMRWMTPVLPIAFGLVRNYATNFVLGLDHDLDV
ncbi:MAG: FAD-dependent monooxygenase [Bacteroidota bacterium]